MEKVLPYVQSFRHSLESFLFQKRSNAPSPSSWQLFEREVSATAMSVSVQAFPFNGNCPTWRDVGYSGSFRLAASPWVARYECSVRLRWPRQVTTSLQWMLTRDKSDARNRSSPVRASNILLFVYCENCRRHWLLRIIMYNCQFAPLMRTLFFSDLHHLSLLAFCVYLAILTFVWKHIDEFF